MKVCDSIYESPMFKAQAGIEVEEEIKVDKIFLTALFRDWLREHDVSLLTLTCRVPKKFTVYIKNERDHQLSLFMNQHEVTIEPYGVLEMGWDVLVATFTDTRLKFTPSQKRISIDQAISRARSIVHTHFDYRTSGLKDLSWKMWRNRISEFLLADGCCVCDIDTIPLFVNAPFISRDVPPFIAGYLYNEAHEKEWYEKNQRLLIKVDGRDDLPSYNFDSSLKDTIDLLSVHRKHMPCPDGETYFVARFKVILYLEKEDIVLREKFNSRMVSYSELTKIWQKFYDETKEEMLKKFVDKQIRSMASEDGTVSAPDIKLGDKIATAKIRPYTKPDSRTFYWRDFVCEHGIMRKNADGSKVDTVRYEEESGSG